MKKYIRDFVFYFCLFYLIATGYQYFFGQKDTIEVPPITLETKNSSITQGNLHTFELKNNTNKILTLSNVCDDTEKFKILTPVPNSQPVNIFKASDCSSLPNIKVEPESKTTFHLANVNANYFTTKGEYSLTLQFDQGQTVTSNTFEITTAGFFRRAFRNLISKPLFNALVFFTKVLPSNSFGLSIIALTLLVRLLLFIPNQKAMRSQRKMQNLQPKLEKLREQYKDNQQMMAMQTMALYKEHKVNPISSCLPLLLQMPFLFGIYYIVRDGLSPHLEYMLYPSWGNTLTDLLNANQMFSWLDLSTIDPYYILPVIVAAAQFLAVKLSLSRKKKQDTKKKDQKAATGMAGQAQQMQKMMLYIMPLMIGFFTATFPSGVGIYWLTSTVFAIFQQWFVNKSLQPKKGQLKRKEK